MIPEEGAVLGIDVGWSVTKKTTGACLLTWTTDLVKLRPTRLGTADTNGIVELLGSRSIDALAVDGPVRGDLTPIGEYRDAERLLTRGLAPRIGKPGQSSSGNGLLLNKGANEIVQLVLSTGKLGLARHDAKIHERAFAEAFPTSFLGVMLDEGSIPMHGARSDIYFAHLLGPNGRAPAVPESDRLDGLIQRLLPGRRLEVIQGEKVSDHCGDIHDHEERAAVICAITALCIAACKYVAVGDARNGYIILPPRAAAGEPGLQPWAWKIISDNATSSCPIIVE